MDGVTTASQPVLHPSVLSLDSSFLCSSHPAPGPQKKEASEWTQSCIAIHTAEELTGTRGIWAAHPLPQVSAPNAAFWPFGVGMGPICRRLGYQTGAEAWPLPHLPTVPTATASSEPDQALLEGTSKGVTPSTYGVVLKS